MSDSETQAYLQHFRPGSKPWRYDPREKGFSHTRYFGVADVSQLPRNGLGRPRRPVENQLNTLRCGPYSAAAGNGYIRKLRFHPDWQTIEISRQQGRQVDGNGSEPRAVMNSLRDNGSALWDSASMHLATHGIEQTSFEPYYPSNLKEQAQSNRIVAYLAVDDRFDYFDDIRWALHRAYNPHSGTGPVVHAFGPWYAEWNNPHGGIISKNYSEFAGWHAFLFIDWCVIDGEQYLIAQNSYGEGIGDKGFLYFPREVVNREFAKWGAALKIPTGALTQEQIDLAKKETALGRIQRAILQAWYLLSEKFGLA